MNALRYTVVGVSLLIFAAACATQPEDETVEVPDEVGQLKVEAEELRATIEEYGLDRYEPEETGLGDEAFEQGDELLEEDPESAAESFEEAIGRFEVAISLGFPALLDERQGEVEESRQEAIDARARTAATDIFDDADELFGQAVEQREAEEYEQSFAMFADAQEGFEESREIAVERRDEARAALDRLDERLREAEDQAEEIERELEEESEIDDEDES